MTIFLDFDGTICNTAQTLYQIVSQTREILQLPYIDVQQFEDLLPKGASTDQFINIFFPGQYLFNKQIYDIITKQTPPLLFDNIENQLLTLCQNKYDLVITTNKKLEIVKYQLHQLKINNYFREIRATPQFKPKPNPEMIFSDGQKSILVGDTHTDFLTAQNSQNSQFLGVLWGFGSKKDFQCAQTIDQVQNLSETLINMMKS